MKFPSLRGFRFRLGTTVAATLLVLFAALATLDPRTLQHPFLKIDISMSAGSEENLSLTMLMNGQSGSKRCEQSLSTLTTSILAVCPKCKMSARECVSALSQVQQGMLSEEPLQTYSARLPNGTTIYESTNQSFARLTCEENERQSLSSRAPVICYAPSTDRALSSEKRPPSQKILAGLALLAISMLASWFICWLILRFEHFHAHLTHDQIGGGPQKFHFVPTPRIAGLAIYAGLIAASSAISIAPSWFRIESSDFGFLLIAAIPAFLGGLTEDITKKVNIVDRLLLTMASGVLCAWLIGAVLNRLDIPGTPFILAWLPLAIIFTAFAVGGIANSINIIDGYHGLAAGYSVIALAAFAWVSDQVQDVLLLQVCLTLIGALLGFLVWNWPRGKLFLGDGGAYLLGFVLAEISVLMVARNTLVSPWFPALILAYPIFETLFSIFRKKILRGGSPGHPDGLHMHMLIYKRLVRTSNRRSNFVRNSLVAIYFWPIGVACAIAGVLNWRSTSNCILGIAVFCIFYVFAYRRIIKFRIPRSLILRW